MADTPPTEDPAALPHFIEKRSHQTHRAQHPDLADLADKEERDCAEDTHAPADLGHWRNKLIDEVAAHMKRKVDPVPRDPTRPQAASERSFPTPTQHLSGRAG